MTAAHTQTPWFFDGEFIFSEPLGCYVGDPQTEDMRSGQYIARNDAHAQIQANGFLMAAAPDLLAALKIARAELIEFGIDCNSAVECIPIIDAAIAKATGAA